MAGSSKSGVYSLARIVERLSVRIECLAAWGSKLVVGTAEGALLIYSAQVHNGKVHVALVHNLPDFAPQRRPVTQLAVFEAHNLLLSLSDTTLCAHRLSSLQLLASSNVTRGAVLFAVQQPVPASKPIGIAVALRRKLVLLHWLVHEKRFKPVQEHALPDQPTGLLWVQDSVFICYRREYALLSIADAFITHLFASNATTSACVLDADAGHVLLAKDSFSIFLGAHGKPVRQYGIAWKEAPLAVAYAHPYVIGVMGKAVDVRTTGTKSQVQVLPLANVRVIACDGHAEVILADAGNIWKLVPHPVTQQLDQLAGNGQYDAALVIGESRVDASSGVSADALRTRVAHLREQYAFHLFATQQYDAAMAQFQRLDIDLSFILALYPSYLPASVRSRYKFPINMPAIPADKMRSAELALIDMLTRQRAARGTSRSIAAGQRQQQSALTRMPSSSSAASLYGTAGGADASDDQHVLLDTALVRAYAHANPSLLAPFLRLPNAADPSVCEGILKEINRYGELVLLFRGHGMHQQALDLLKWSASQSQPAIANAVHEAVKYVQTLDAAHFQLVLETSVWVMRTDVDLALKIFAHDSEQVMTWPRDRVLQHLQTVAPQLAPTYLEYVIAVLHDVTPSFHNQLAVLYLDIIEALRARPGSPALSDAQPGSEAGLLGVTRGKLLRFLEQSMRYSAESLLPRVPDDLACEQAVLLGRIGDHGRALSIYVTRLRQRDAAERYCARVWKEARDLAASDPADPVSQQVVAQGRGVYLHLLSVYLHADPPQMQQAVHVLERWHERIDALQALALLPADQPLADVFPALNAMLQQGVLKRRAQSLVHRVAAVGKMSVESMVIAQRKASVRLDDYTACLVCQRRIGTSVPACFPSGAVVHLRCAADLSADPISGLPLTPTSASAAAASASASAAAAAPAADTPR